MGVGLFPTLMTLADFCFSRSLSSGFCVSWITARLGADCWLFGHLDTPFWSWCIL